MDDFGEFAAMDGSAAVGVGLATQPMAIPTTSMMAPTARGLFMAGIQAAAVVDARAIATSFLWKIDFSQVDRCLHSSYWREDAGAAISMICYRNLMMSFSILAHHGCLSRESCVGAGGHGRSVDSGHGECRC